MWSALERPDEKFKLWQLNRLGRRKGPDNTANFWREKTATKPRTEKSAASKARHIQLVTQVLPEPGLEAGIESVKERITHAMVWQSWLLPAHLGRCCSSPLLHSTQGFGVCSCSKTSRLDPSHCTSSCAVPEHPRSGQLWFTTCMSSWHKWAAKPLNYTQDKDRQAPQNCFPFYLGKKAFASCSSCHPLGTTEHCQEHSQGWTYQEVLLVLPS